MLLMPVKYCGSFSLVTVTTLSPPGKCLTVGSLSRLSVPNYSRELHLLFCHLVFSFQTSLWEDVIKKKAQWLMAGISGGDIMQKYVWSWASFNCCAALLRRFATTAQFEIRDQLTASKLPRYHVLYYKWKEDCRGTEPRPTAQQNDHHQYNYNSSWRTG